VCVRARQPRVHGRRGAVSSHEERRRLPRLMPPDELQHGRHGLRAVGKLRVVPGPALKALEVHLCARRHVRRRWRGHDLQRIFHSPGAAADAERVRATPRAWHRRSLLTPYRLTHRRSAEEPNTPRAFASGDAKVPSCTHRRPTGAPHGMRI
jgi:hypothetical protein